MDEATGAMLVSMRVVWEPTVVGPLVCSCNLGHGRPNMLDPMMSPWIWVRDDGWESLWYVNHTQCVKEVAL